jgi:hypothetical protein
MRFLPSNPGRTAAEVLLTAAIVAFVVYDLSGHSSVKPESSSNVVLSFEAKRPSALPAVDAASSSRFDTAVTGITSANTFTVCGNTAAPTNPWLIGNGTNQALIIQLGGGCIANPAIQITNSSTNATSLAGINVQSGSWLSFQNIQSQGTSAGATSWQLTMASGSTLETVLASGLPANPLTNLVYPLLLAAGACPSFIGVTIPATTNCPFDPTITTGVYGCAVSYASFVSSGVTYCALLLTVSGALTQSSAPITFTFGKDCSTYTVANFKSAVQTATGVSAVAINVVAWQCGSITVTFTVLGSNPALIAAAVASILAASAPGGALYSLLGGITISGSVTVTITPGTVNGLGYYPVAYCRYYPCPSTQTFDPSSRNPGLFALLTLLVIPVAIFVGLLIYACLPRAPVCEPVPMCPPAPVCPAPAPVVYYAEPCAMPCDPCMGAQAPACF